MVHLKALGIGLLIVVGVLVVFAVGLTYCPLAVLVGVILISAWMIGLSIVERL